MKGVIYKIKNTLTGREYVGKTIKTLDDRLRRHSKANSHIGHAIQKHGVAAFEMSVLAISYDEEELDFLEIQMVKSCNTQWPNGYNHTAGGEGQRSPSPETREKMSKMRRGRKEDPEHAFWRTGLAWEARQANAPRFRCEQTGKVYRNQTACAKELGICASSICQALKGRRGSVRGLDFTWVDAPRARFAHDIIPSSSIAGVCK